MSSLPPGDIIVGINQTEREADNAPPSNFEVLTAYNFTYMFLVRFCGGTDEKHAKPQP
jgi:hypothetical protein